MYMHTLTGVCMCTYEQKVTDCDMWGMGEGCLFIPSMLRIWFTRVYVRVSLWLFGMFDEYNA